MPRELRRQGQREYHIDPSIDPDRTIAQSNYLYANNNPNPSTICNECKQHIGHVFEPGTEPSLPRHHGCFCYYVATNQPPTQ